MHIKGGQFKSFMPYAALIPFLVLFFCFVILRISLPRSAFVALLFCTILSGTQFPLNTEQWNQVLIHTGRFMAEIGVILAGAFFFLEVARQTLVLKSIGDLISAVCPDRIFQALMIAFPLALMIEGSSGFGTPLLVVAPILATLGFPPLLCACLPLINLFNGVAFGAMGTPLKLGFPISDFTPAVVLLSSPFLLITPIISVVIIKRHLNLTLSFQKLIRVVLWIILLAISYFLPAYWVAHFGPEFSALLGGLSALLMGFFSARFFFETVRIQEVFSHPRGILIYGLLLACLAVGKSIFLDRTSELTGLRLFNPGLIFVVFGGALLIFNQQLRSKRERFSVIKSGFLRARRPLTVLFCLIFMVQQLRANGALDLARAELSQFWLSDGISLLAWLSSTLIGTSTVANLLLSQLVDHAAYPALAIGSALGTQLALQGISAVRSALHDTVTESQIFRFMVPLSVAFVLILMLIQAIL